MDNAWNVLTMCKMFQLCAECVNNVGVYAIRGGKTYYTRETSLQKIVFSSWSYRKYLDKISI